jgi:antitoxin (DNA-binding transcriptional repressor) of toxin-antitoxin stability system
MKTITVREFYHNAGLVDGLAYGKQLVVTAHGKPKFIVSKGVKPRMTRKLAGARAIGDSKGSKFDGTAFLASLKK